MRGSAVVGASLILTCIAHSIWEEYHKKAPANLTTDQALNKISNQMDDIVPYSPFRDIGWWKSYIMRWEYFQIALQASILTLLLKNFGPSLLRTMGLTEEAEIYGINSSYDKINAFAKKVLKIPDLQGVLQYYADRLSHAADSEMRIYYERGLLSTCMYFNERIEILLGFMHYRLDHQKMKPGLVAQGTEVIEYLMHITNDFYDRVEGAINDEDHETQEKDLSKVIREFCYCFEQEVNHFALLEGV